MADEIHPPSSGLTAEELRRCDCCGLLLGIAGLMRGKNKWITPEQAAQAITDVAHKCDPTKKL